MAAKILISGNESKTRASMDIMELFFFKKVKLAPG